MPVIEQLLQHISISYRKKFGVPLVIRNINALGGGCINHALKLDTDQGPLFLKWNGSVPDDLFIREAESLSELHKSENEFLLFPNPLLAKEIGLLPGYLLTSYLQPGNNNNQDEKLGRGLALLHKVTQNRFGFQNNNYCGATLQDNSLKTNWHSFYTENRIGHIVKLIRQAREWKENDEKVLEAFLKKVPSLIDHNPVPSLIHGDLWSGNRMFTAQGPALIDPCASYCDREFEMGIMTMFGGFSPTVYAAYNEAYPLPYGWRERNNIYQLYHILNHYYLFGGHYKHQALEIMKRFV
jgi:protein-ribulosamine 3-kinase